MKANVLKYVVPLAAIVIAIVALVNSKSVATQSDLQIRSIEAVRDLETAIKTIEKYEDEGAFFTNEQHEALISAVEKKREARRLKNSGNYKESARIAAEGIDILEKNFPVIQFPLVCYPQKEGWWREGI